MSSLSPTQRPLCIDRDGTLIRSDVDRPLQVARTRGRGYRNAETFVTMTYLIGSPAGSVRKSI